MAAYCATLPMQFVKLARNTEGDTHVAAATLGAGMLIWALWTLMIFAIGSLFVCPVVLLVKEEWLLARRRGAIAISAATGWAVVMVEFRIWHLLGPDPYINVWMFSLYSLLFVVFSAVMAAVYLLFLRRAQTAGRAAID